MSTLIGLRSDEEIVEWRGLSKLRDQVNAANARAKNAEDELERVRNDLKTAQRSLAREEGRVSYLQEKLEGLQNAQRSEAAE